MAETLLFELVAPERLLVSKPVAMVIMPGTEGYFGAQPDHAPVIATLGPGVIDVYEGDRVTDRIFVAGGFAEVGADRCTVLAEEAVPVSELDRAKAEQQVRDLREDLADAGDDATRADVQAKLAVASAKLEAASAAAAH